MKIISCKQVHGDNVYIVNSKNINNIVPECDGLITNLKNVKLVIRTADCLPISITDRNKKVVGVIHLGWRGTQKKIVQKAISIFVRKFKSNPSDIKVKIGPSIDKDDFLIRKDVYDIFKEKYIKYFEKINSNQWKMDLKGINISQLMDNGVLRKNIKISKISTYNNKKYPSFRRDGTAKRFLTRVMIK